MSFRFQLLPREKTNVFEGCATGNEFISTSIYVNVFPSVFQEIVTLQDAGLERKLLWLNGIGKCHFWRFTVHTSSIKVLKKLCSPQTSISQYYLTMRTFCHVKPSKSQQSYGTFFETCLLGKYPNETEPFSSPRQPLGEQSSGSSDPVQRLLNYSFS